MQRDAEGDRKEEAEDAQVRQVQEPRGDQRAAGTQEELPVEGLRLRQLLVGGPEAASHGRSGWFCLTAFLSIILCLNLNVRLIKQCSLYIQKSYLTKDSAKWQRQQVVAARFDLFCFNFTEQ